MSEISKIARQLARRNDIDPAGGPKAAWSAIARANRIFGALSWSREILDMRNAANREREGVFTSAYVARIRISVVTNTGTLIREGQGCAEGRGATPFDAHDQGIKAAELDATLRTLALFGNAFGQHVLTGALHSKRAPAKPASAKQSEDPDSKTSQPPSPNADEPAQAQRDCPSPSPCPFKRIRPYEREGGMKTTAKPNNSPAHARSAIAEPDMSAMLIPKLRRLRSPAHLAFVRAQPCLICGRTPADAHHLRFVQPRAMGRKVSDEFTVPLCRYHHGLLHRDPDEQEWWQAMGIDPLAIALELWEESEKPEPGPWNRR